MKILAKGKEIAVRQPRKGDERKMLEYINALVKEKVYIAAGKKKTLKDEKKFLGEILADIKKRKKFVAVFECGGKIISMAEAWKGKHDKNSHVCEFALALLKEYRGYGLGNKIMEILLDVAKRKLKCRIARLSVYEPNTTALKLYKKFGFKETGRIPKGVNHFGKYCDEIIMVKEL